MLRLTGLHPTAVGQKGGEDAPSRRCRADSPPGGLPPARLPRLRDQRGATLIVAVVTTAVLAVIAATLVRRVAVEMESANAKRHYDTAVSCADGARELLVSQFRTFGANPTTLTLNQPVGDRRYASGHYDTFGIQSVETVGAEQFASTLESAMDLSNRAIRTRLGGAFYRITVVCSDRNQQTRQSEVEFLVRFGL